MSDEGVTGATGATEVAEVAERDAADQREAAERETAALEAGDAMHPAPGLLPGEVRPHPSPVQYVLIAVILVVITSFEVGLYYAGDAMPRPLLVTLLLVSALLKFLLVASWYMHLRTDQPIFRRFFVLGITAAIALYMIVLATFNVFSE